MKEVLLIKEGEIALKGLNKRNFEEAFIRNLRHRLKSLGEFEYRIAQSTVYVKPLSEDMDFDEVYDRASKVFGAAAICRCAVCEKDMAAICRTACEYCEPELGRVRTFKVAAKRADKAFPLKSPEICVEVGHEILEKYHHLDVDVSDPQLVVHVEVRDDGAFIHTGNRTAAGGIPVGTSGRALLLLSGGIDSPVAGYMMAKRGVDVACIHYVSPPYTSDRARLKVERLCEKLTPYLGDVAFFCVPFTKIQEALRDNCPEELFTILMRCIMLDIAEKIARKKGMHALVTGESLGQVASQTMQAMVCTDASVTMPVLRPVVGMDKTEIIDIARKIDTFDISIEPYEDCCTVFTPKHPRTKPDPAAVKAALLRYDFEPLIAEAVENTEIKTFKHD